MNNIQVNSIKDLENFALEICKKIKPACTIGLTIGLIGQLGAGKTTLAKLLAVNLGTNADLSSPTYVLCMEYELRDNIRLEHWDLYRTNEIPDELYEQQEKVIKIIEWIDKFPELSQKADLLVKIDFFENEENSQARKISYFENIE